MPRAPPPAPAPAAPVYVHMDMGGLPLPPGSPGHRVMTMPNPFSVFHANDNVTQTLMNDPVKRRQIREFSGCELTDESERFLYELFCRLDTDHSGGLSDEDLNIAKSAICASDQSRHTRKQSAMMVIINDLQLGEADTDGDGQVDFGEFVAAFKKKVLSQPFHYPSIQCSHVQMLASINVELNKQTQLIVSQMADYLATNS